MGRAINPGIGGAGSAIVSSSSSSSGVVDPRREGYPMYVNIHGEGNSYWNVRILDSNLNAVGSPWSAALNTTLSYKSGVLNDSTYGYSTDGGSFTSNYTSQPVSITNIYQSVHHDDQYPFNMAVNANAGGMFEGVCTHSISRSKWSFGRFLISQILPEGTRPRRFFGLDDDVFFEYHNLSTMEDPKSRFDLTPFFSVDPSTGGNHRAMGSACYNERTNTLVTLHRVAASAVFNVFTGQSGLNLNKEKSCPNPKKWFENASVTGFTIGSGFGNTTVTDERATRVILGDNGQIATVQRLTTTLQYRLIEGGAITATDTVSGGWNTGPDQGSQYYIKTKMTWDNNWSWSGLANYQEGGEFRGYLISTKNPARYIKYASDSGNRYQNLLPNSRSAFMSFDHVNTDGVPAELCVLDLDLDQNPLTGTDPIIARVGASPTAQERAIGSSLNTSYFSVPHNHGYYSTSYGYYAPLNWWPRKWEFGNG